MKKLLSSLLLLLSYSAIHTMDYTQQKEVEKYSKLNIIGQIGAGLTLSYLNAFANTFFHEMGHACTAKLLFNSPICVALGAYKIPDPGIHLNGFHPLGGASLLIPTESMSNIKLASVYLAGPLIGITYAVMLNYFFNKQKVLPPLTTRICKWFNNIALCSNISQLSPFHLAYDGGKVANQFKLLKFDKNGLAILPSEALIAGGLITSATANYPIVAPIATFFYQLALEDD